jgi:hypothetical protein
LPNVGHQKRETVGSRMSGLRRTLRSDTRTARGRTATLTTIPISDFARLQRDGQPMPAHAVVGSKRARIHANRVLGFGPIREPGPNSVRASPDVAEAMQFER